MKPRALAAWGLLALALGLVSPLACLLASWMIGAVFVMVSLSGGPQADGGAPMGPIMVGAGAIVAAGVGLILWQAYRAIRPGPPVPSLAAAALPLGLGAWLGYLGLARALAGAAWA